MVRVVFGHHVVMKREGGFGLFESILGMALMAMAVAIFMTQLLPFVRDSGTRHHATQSLALGESLLHRILAVPFDHNSDPSGKVRCDQGLATDRVQCSDQLGAEVGELFAFNDVDDFLGCWADNSTFCPPELPHQPLDRLIPDPDGRFFNYRVLISVYYDHNFDGKPDTTALLQHRIHKRIALTVDSGRGEPMTWAAYRSNY